MRIVFWEGKLQIGVEIWRNDWDNEKLGELEFTEPFVLILQLLSRIGGFEAAWLQFLSYISGDVGGI